jgi:hypothetical protein
VKKVLVMFLGVFLVLTIAGCGGSSGSSGNDSEIKISSDYLGFETGFKLTYDETTIENGSTDTATYIQYTIGVASSYGTNIYKVVYGTSTTRGEYIKIDGNKYYGYGSWETGESDEIESSPILVVTNPITTPFTTPGWGVCKGQEKVTVPVGTFTAWLFENDYTDEGATCCDKRWIVPYLGMVQGIYTATQNGALTWEQTDQLKSYAKNATLRSSSLLKSAQVSSQPTNKHKGLFN